MFYIYTCTLSGPCTKDAIYDTACGTRLISWYLDGPEYLLQFHSDSSMNGDGFQLQYYLGKHDLY